MDPRLSILDRLLDRLLPQDCLLCLAPSGAEALCDECRTGLPALPYERCPVCALPTPGGAVCGACLRHPPAFDATHAPWRYAFPVDKLVQALKYGHRIALAQHFARNFLTAPRPDDALLIPLPLSRQRIVERGFNQAMEIARPLAAALGLPLDAHGTLRIRDTVPQTSLPWKARRKNIRHAFAATADYRSRHVIVIDDVMTTGATLDEFAQCLKDAGAASVTNWVLARAVKD
jgi:ComF family protein